MSFNDDDYYVYWEATRKLAYRSSGKSPRPVPLPGQAVAKGMTSKHLNLSE